MATPNTRVMLTDSLGNAHYLSLSITGAFLNIVDTATGNTVQLDMRNGTIADNTDLALKAPIASPTFTGTVAGITKAMVGLDLVDNTADLSKPVSTATQTALNLKVTLAGTAGGQTINGGTAAGESLTLTGTSSATKSATGIKLGSVVTVDEVNSRVGVGTTSPALNFEVRSDGTATWQARMGLSNATADKQVFLGSYGANAVVAAHNFGLTAWADLYINTVDGAAGMVVKGAGKVGIGTVTPAVNLDVVGLIKTSGYTVSTLPAGVTGARAYVTDATAPTYNGALTGGGTVVVPVFFNGTAWVAA